MADNVRFEFHTKEVKDLISDLVRKGNREVKRGVEESTKEGLNLMQEMLNKQGRGRMYLSGQSSSRMYRASAPGEPPATDTGTYRDSWTTDIKGGGFKGRLFTGDKRGPWLEYGTEHMDARPHVIPWFRRHNVIHKKIIFKALREAARKSKQ